MLGLALAYIEIFGLLVLNLWVWAIELGLWEESHSWSFIYCPKSEVDALGP